MGAPLPPDPEPNRFFMGCVSALVIVGGFYLAIGALLWFCVKVLGW